MVEFIGLLKVTVKKVPESYGLVKLEVYDYDTFSADDIMGEAELDIQPLVTSAMAFGDPEMFGDM
ncbi:hypothetical protein F2Q69_00050138 [Brassica cretica]|uniref:C2 domain-containing protein n=1 Tax=Brassica cretica TaxID=69181 RepID=A0A8S9PMA7_BRACR|nr:hypothetical protein F2Q69_00050138 [Brassica cretica]